MSSSCCMQHVVWSFSDSLSFLNNLDTEIIGLLCAVFSNAFKKEDSFILGII